AFYSGLAVLGAIAVFFGSIGEVSYDKLHVKANPLTMNVLGGSLLICGIVIYVWEKRRTGDRPVPSVSDYEVRIITPMNGAHIGVMDFAGTLKKALPDG
ncbi:hypothetical protein, partial [Burkholderia sp. SIMBA_048]|uniref:hypothetical protein n=1 Tax=Burkholderia sp. SIMBA_048 TaxID=3085789 RepID=UPI00397A2BB4